MHKKMKMEKILKRLLYGLIGIIAGFFMGGVLVLMSMRRMNHIMRRMRRMRMMRMNHMELYEMNHGEGKQLKKGDNGE